MSQKEKDLTEGLEKVWMVSYAEGEKLIHKVFFFEEFDSANEFYNYCVGRGASAVIGQVTVVEHN